MAEIIQPEDFPVFNISTQPEDKEVGKDNPHAPTIVDPLLENEDDGVETPEEVEENEIEKPDDSGEPQVEETTGEEFDPKAYFELAASLGVLDLPEDFQFNEEDPETSVLAAIDYTFQQNYKKAEEALLGSVQDSLVADLIKYGIEGGKFADLNQYFNVAQQETNYDALDLDDEENQIRVYKDYLNSTGRFTEKRINQMIEMLQEDDELSSEAQKAKDYFIQEARKQKENLSKAAKERQEAEERAAYKRQQEFVTALSSSGFSKPQQQKILNSFSTVELENGRTVRAFEKTLLEIQNNPQHYIEFLSLLNEYDPSKGFTHKKIAKEKETEITKSVLDKFKEAATHLGKGTRATANDKPIVPRDNPYVKNITRY